MRQREAALAQLARSLCGTGRALASQFQDNIRPGAVAYGFKPPLVAVTVWYHGTAVLAGTVVP